MTDLPTSDCEELCIDRLAVGGDGVGRIDGKVVFVPGALPGERVVVRRREDKRRYARADLVELLESSDVRRSLDCPHESDSTSVSGSGGGCGGCGFRHVDDAHSLHLKTEPIIAEMAKIAPEIAWPKPTLHPEVELDAARQRIRFHLASGDQDSGVLGLFQKGTHTPLAVPQCRAVHPEILEGVRALEGCIAASKTTKSPRTVLIERDDVGLVALWQAIPSRDLERRLSRIVEEGAFTSIRCRSKRQTIDLGDPWMTESARVGERDLVYHRLTGTFGQANPSANQAIRTFLHATLQQLSPRRLVDLYAGSGNFSILAALSANEVVAVEVARGALEGLQRSAEKNKLYNIKILQRDLSRGLGGRLKSDRPDVVLLDPPRTGALEVCRDLVALSPEHVLYLSCSPTHLARDARLLADRYRVVSLDAFDMFPRTPHVEILAHFRFDSESGRS